MEAVANSLKDLGTEDMSVTTRTWVLLSTVTRSQCTLANSLVSPLWNVGPLQHLPHVLTGDRRLRRAEMDEALSTVLGMKEGLCGD